MRSKAAELKRLQTLKKDMELELEGLKEQQKRVIKLMCDLNENLDKINIQMEVLKNKEIIISEHAIVRYFERILKFDMDKLREKILTDKFMEQYITLGNGTYPVEGENFKVIIKNGVIVTIVGEE